MLLEQPIKVRHVTESAGLYDLFIRHLGLDQQLDRVFQADASDIVAEILSRGLAKRAARAGGAHEQRLGKML